MKKETEVSVVVGDGVNAYSVHVLASMSKAGGVEIKLAPGKNGNANMEEVALRKLQAHPNEALKQVMKAMVSAGVEGADEKIELASSALVPGPNVPLHKHDARLSPDFLATVLCAYRSCILTWPDVRVFFEMAGVELPAQSEMFTDAELKAADLLDGDGPAADGVQDAPSTVQ